MSIALWAEVNALKERLGKAEARVAEVEHQLAVRAEADRMHMATARDTDSRLEQLASTLRGPRRTKAGA